MPSASGGAGGWRGGWSVVGGSLAVLAVGVLATAAGRGFAAPVSDPAAREIVGGLLTNVHHAFAYRDESRTFDALAESVDGPLLEALYLDIRRGLEDARGGGPRVRVLDVRVIDCDVRRATGAGLLAEVTWVSTGSVSHWGHTHRRQNRYRAAVAAEPVGGRWRLTGVDILQEQRI